MVADADNGVAFRLDVEPVTGEEEPGDTVRLIYATA